ncbi:MAG: hypothetical protein HOP30_14755 [Cyclobacteriaceae bacterium]|nr:hypothetical protein [Cyclobacteriaceae bacterium]
MVTSATIAQVIKTRFRLVQLPFDLTMTDAGLKHEDLLTLHQLLARNFYHAPKDVRFTDTVYTLTEKINDKEGN